MFQTKIVSEGYHQIVDAGTPEPLVAESTPCRSIWVAAPHNNLGAPINTRVIRLSSTGVSGLGYQLLPGDYHGFLIPAADAHDLLVRSAIAGEGLLYILWA